MAMSKEVNVGVLQEQMKKVPKFTEAMEILAKRRRGRIDTTFARIKRMLNEGGMQGWTFQELRSFFDVLELAGAGRIVNGSTPDRARFMWNFHLQSVACAALGMPDPHRGKNADEEEGMRRPTPARRELPRIAAPAPPVTFQAPRTPAAVASSKPAARAQADGNVLVFERGGLELEIDLSKVPKDAISVRRVL